MLHVNIALWTLPQSPESQIITTTQSEKEIYASAKEVKHIEFFQRVFI